MPDFFSSHFLKLLILFPSPAGEALQWNDRSWPSLCQRQQAFCQRYQGSVAAVQEGGNDIGKHSA